MSEMKNRTPQLPTGQEAIDPGFIRRPIRTMSQEIVDMVTNKDTVLMILAASLLAMALLPQIWIYVVPSMSAYYAAVVSRKYRLPFKVPQLWGGIDFGSLKPGGRGFNLSSAILFFGHCMRTGEQLWLENGDARRHGFFLGTTGSGKALPLDALVLTPFGWVPNGDLRPGDHLIHPDGSTVKVHSIHPQGTIPAVQMSFADGRDAICSVDHLWQVRLQPREGMMPAGLEEKDEIRTAGDLGILIGLQGDSVKVSVPMPKPADMQPALNVGLIDFRDRIENADWQFDFTPATRGSVLERMAFLRGWAGATTSKIIVKDNALRAHDLDPKEAVMLKHLVWSLGGTATTIYPFSRTGHHERMDLVFNFAGIAEIFPQAADLTPPIDLEVIQIDRLENDLPMSCIKTEREDGLYVMEQHIVTHNTELLLGVVSQSLMWSSGFLFVDGKGTPEFYARAWTLCKRFCREDDLRVLNFTDSGGDPDAPAGGPDIESNTINPFAKGGPDQLMNIVVSLMGDSGSGGDMWKNRAQILVTAEMKALCELRDAGDILLNVQTIRDFLALGRGVSKEVLQKVGTKKITNIKEVPAEAWAEMRERSGMIELYLRACNNEFSEATYLALKGFFDTLPVFSMDKALNGMDQDPKCNEQFSYLSMQLTKPLGSLADDYGHIFRTPLGEVDIDDVVLNRRILIVLLPALQKATDEMKNCGKIIVSLCKSMMGNASGSEIQGSRQERVESKQTRAPSPYIVVFDEAGYYMVEGLDVMMAQARSLGFMIIVAGQDMAAMQKTSPQIAETAIANARIFAVGATEDAGKSWEFISKKFGRTQVAVTSGYTQHAGVFTNSWADRMDSTIQEVDKVKIEELQAMVEGEFYFLFNGTIVKAATFFVGDRFAEGFSVNKFIKVRGPLDRVPGLDQRREEVFLKRFTLAGTAISKLVKKDIAKEDDPNDSLSRIMSKVNDAEWRSLTDRGEAQPSTAATPFLSLYRDALLDCAAEEEEDELDFDLRSTLDFEVGAEIDELMQDIPSSEEPPQKPDLASRLQSTISEHEGLDFDDPMTRGLGQVASGKTEGERAGGMVAILVGHQEARKQAEDHPVIARYHQDVDDRLRMERTQRRDTVHDFLNRMAADAQRLSKLFEEENVAGDIALEILRNTGVSKTLPLTEALDDKAVVEVFSDLESYLLEEIQAAQDDADDRRLG
jgi:hypothetical protein